MLTGFCRSHWKAKYQMREPTDLSKLRNLLSRMDERTPTDRWALASDSIGLRLTPELTEPIYDATPKNCLVFAYTGGDGVHFSFLNYKETAQNNCPIVMTVPMYPEMANLIVGRDLREFLALGLRIGYFFLEQLQYDRSDWILELESGQYYSALDHVDIDTLRAIESEFDITPWDNPGERLDALQSGLS